MKKGSVELAVGVFVLVGLVCVGYLAVRLGQMEIVGGGYYTVSARFRSISGLKVGADIEMAGVPIGRVNDIGLDLERQVAVVQLKIQKEIPLAEDVIASIKTAGLIGDKYIRLTPGVSDIPLEPGGTISQTEPVLDIEDLVSKYVFGKV